MCRVGLFSTIDLVGNVLENCRRHKGFLCCLLTQTAVYLMCAILDLMVLEENTENGMSQYLPVEDSESRIFPKHKHKLQVTERTQEIASLGLWERTAYIDLVSNWWEGALVSEGSHAFIKIYTSCFYIQFQNHYCLGFQCSQNQMLIFFSFSRVWMSEAILDTKNFMYQE